jgi:hypothetical protein
MATSTLVRPPVGVPAQPKEALPSVAAEVAVPSARADREADARTATIMVKLLALLFIWLALIVPLGFVLVGLFVFS